MLFNVSENERVKIYSVGSYLPEEVLKSDDIFTEIKSDIKYNTPVNWMSKTMGIVERRMSPVNTQPSDLAVPAAQKAIDESGINPDLIDMVVFCGIESDHSEPATAHAVQHKLGLKANHVFDVSNACFGFINGIEIASNFIRSGTVRFALVCTGEVSSRVVRSLMQELKSCDLPISHFHNVIGGLSIGDAGGAVVLGPSCMGESTGFKLFHTKSDSSHIEKCYYSMTEEGLVDGQMKMGPIVGASIWMHRKIISETLDKLGWDKFDWALMHQTGKRPYEKFMSFSTVDEDRVIKTFDKIGNVASATFPINYEKLLKTGKNW